MLSPPSAQREPEVQSWEIIFRKKLPDRYMIHHCIPGLSQGTGELNNAEPF